MEKYIDLRSDTVTRPSPEMRKAMFEAEVGDDVFQEDPTVNALQEYVADLLGKEAALFVSSGVMGNQLCLNVLTNPGDEVIEVENTHNRAGGTIQPLDNIIELGKLAKKYNLHYHLDGARIWNASVASAISVKEYATYFDTISCCLSKGLGAPVGSIIAGSKDFITEAFRIRKSWGGGMRQLGILAAAGLYALKNNISRLEEDHRKAKMLAEVLGGIKSIKIDLDAVQTNIIIFKPMNISVDKALLKCKEKGLLLSLGSHDFLRTITHLDVSFKDIDKTKKILKEVFE